ncbi:thrombomodulin [Nematolebias whitei]|uniref:thrombomodulin n=1 Tax=Nematolebias whitei TaxID=451745 RepID=UPI0018977E9E|nr:thrombomodulin [Nematolebias whitei]
MGMGKSPSCTAGELLHSEPDRTGLRFRVNMVRGLLVLLVLVGGGAGQKPSGGYCIGTGCFSLFREPTDFRTAQRLCRDRGGHLMTVRSSVSNDVLSVLLGSLTGGFWIGLHRLGGCPDPAGGLRGFQWVTEDSESDITNFVPSFNSSCSAHGCVSVNREDSFRWRQSACARPAAGFLCEHSFTEPCRALPAEPGRSVLYMTPYGFGVEDVHAVPPGSTVTRGPSGTKHICISAQWVHAPWSCQIQQGGCEYRCTEGPGGGAVCSCPPGQTVDPANRVSCTAPGPCAARRCQQTCSTAADGSAMCGCAHGLTLAGDGRSCVDVTECADARQCRGENFRCVNTQAGFACVCAAGFKKRGDRCVDVDECVSAPCEHMCVNTQGSYMCACYDGYRADDEAPDKCRLFCGGAECPATCDPNDPRQCFCPEGFVSEERPEGVFCLEIDECNYDYCDHTCVNTPGSYVCSCHPGFKLLDQYRCVESEEDLEGSRVAPTSSVPWSSSVPSPEPTRRPSAVTLPGLVGVIVCTVLLLVLLVFGVHVGLGHRERRRRKSSTAEDETHDLQTATSLRK